MWSRSLLAEHTHCHPPRHTTRRRPHRNIPHTIPRLNHKIPATNPLRQQRKHTLILDCNNVHCSPMNTTTSSYQHVVFLVVLSTWSYRALLFHPSEWNEYCEHWDDRANFLVSPHVTSTPSFSSFYTMCTTSSINVWEPYGNLLKNIIFAIGGTAWTQRITSWFFHTSSSILLYFLSQNMLRLFLSTDPTTSTPDAGTDHSYMATSTCCFVGTAIWLCSPLHAEVIGWASVQPYTPAVFLSLCSLHVYVSNFQHRTRTFMVHSIALFGCGLLFKSVVLPLLPVAVLCLELLFGSVHSCYKNTSIVGYWLVVGCIGWITMLENDGSDTDMVAIASLVQRVVKANSMVWMYIRYFVWPSSLRPHYRLAGEQGDGRNAYTLGTNVHARDGTLAAMYSFAIALGCVPSLLLQSRGQKMKMKTVLLVSFMYVFICFLPTAGIVQHGMVQAGGDRYAYIPSLIVVVVAASALRHLRNNRFAHVSIVLLLFSWSEICNDSTIPVCCTIRCKSTQTTGVLWRLWSRCKENGARTSMLWSLEHCMRCPNITFKRERTASFGSK